MLHLASDGPRLGHGGSGVALGQLGRDVSEGIDGRGRKQAIER